MSLQHRLVHIDPKDMYNLQSRKLLVWANYNELTLHGKIHKTTDKSESTCYLTHVLYSIQDQRAAREWNMRARCQLEHAGLWYNRTSSSFVQPTRNMKASILISYIISKAKDHVTFCTQKHIFTCLPVYQAVSQVVCWCLRQQLVSKCVVFAPYHLPLMSKYIVSAHSLNKLHLAPYE